MTLGRVEQEPGSECPCCNRPRCRGRCWCCMKAGTCAEPPHGHLARDCPFKDIGFDKPELWDKEFKKNPHIPCMKCGNTGHPDHACPLKHQRRTLMRLAKDSSTGRWVNSIVAICTLKDGHEETEETTPNETPGFQILRERKIFRVIV